MKLNNENDDMTAGNKKVMLPKILQNYKKTFFWVFCCAVFFMGGLRHLRDVYSYLGSV